MSSRNTITRRAYGAYDPDVWVIQTYLSELGFNPGPIDGQWGQKTLSAALTFRSWAGLPAAAGTDAGSVIDEDFWTQIDRATASAGFDINLTAPASLPGGAGVAPSVSGGVPAGGGASAPAPAPSGSSSLSTILPLAILGLGAFIAFGGKKGR